MSRPHKLTVGLFLVWSVLFLSQPALAGEPVYAVDISHWQGEITFDEVACMRNSGVQHLIAGVLNPSIAANQLATASAGGMTVDIYVYLYWSGNITAQVQSALAVGAPYPVRRLWLDAENARGSFTQAQIVQKLQEAVNACGSMPCGIYTRKVWWQDNTGDSTAFSHLPIWYAYYDNTADFDDWYDPIFWYEGPFGGWADPTGKQYNDRPALCGVGVDHNIMYAAEDLPPPPEDEIPPAPTGLTPDGTSFANDSSVTMSCNPIPGAAQYEFEIWYKSAGSWYQYYAYAPNTNSQTFWPVYNNTDYRWRVRAYSATAVGPWSTWATFKLGATPPAAPTGLTASAISSGGIDLSWADASPDETGFRIQRQDPGGAFSTIATVGANVTSYTDTGLTPETLYAYRVRAYNGAGNSTFSNTASATTLSPEAPQPVLRQVMWRSGVSYVRIVPFVPGTSKPDWAQASGWSTESLAGLPGSGTLQTWDTYAMGSALLESFWRGDQGYYRFVPWASNGHPDYSAAPAWKGPLPLSSLPGVGSIQAFDSFRAGSVLWQSLWRGGQGWYRTVPVNSGGAPIWSQANPWNGPLGLSGLPGQGSLQTLSGEVYPGERHLLQSLWRSNQGYWRLVPIDAAGKILWGQAQPWSAPIPIDALPGSGDIEAQAGAVYYVE